VGSIIDTRNGAVGLQAARGPSGGIQVGTFFGGKFKVVQKKKLRRGQRRHTTDLRLTGGRFVACRAAGTKAREARRRRRRHLWGSATGSYRSVGENSAATVRGTKWLVKDTCAGTLTRVRRGVVVVHDFQTGKNIKLRRGQSYLARF
jgi:hypothetical protein